MLLRARLRPRVRPTDWPPALTATWLLVGTAVLVQIVYPLVPEPARTVVTVGSVLTFCAASLADAVRVHGVRGLAALTVVAGGGGLLVEAVGLRTGVPFGHYAYTGGLGPSVLDVPVVVPLAWMMMAWPALVVGRTLGRTLGRAATLSIGAWALASWDVFLDPQMVDAGHWAWTHPDPGLPLVPGIPLTNYTGWLAVALVMIAALHALLPARGRPSAPAATLYLWTYASSVLAHLAFFGLPGSAAAGAVLMGLVAVPFAVTLRRRVAPRSPIGRAGVRVARSSRLAAAGRGVDRVDVAVQAPDVHEPVDDRRRGVVDRSAGPEPPPDGAAQIDRVQVPVPAADVDQAARDRG